jgi:hypothetical protein
LGDQGRRDRKGSFLCSSLHRELDDALGLTDMASEVLVEARTGKNSRHALAGLLRRAVFGRLAGYEDVVHLANPGWKIFKSFPP